jgi:CRISPR system Cascade subunit CasA
MTRKENIPEFNLWTMPWIPLEDRDGKLTVLGLEQALRRAHKVKGIYESSPLAIAGIQRLMIAIVQDIFDPETPEDIRTLWKAGHFPEDAIVKFGRKSVSRFDIFSKDQPFLQSGDLGLTPAKGDKVKPVAYFFGDIPAGTAVTHYRHGHEDEHFFCPTCAAIGLVIVPAFATSGGAGIKPSINGVPPIYVMPGGRNLFEALTASLVTEAYQPRVAAGKKKDRPWWRRETVIEKSGEVREVGYLHSLTFPARRVRLHPIPMDTPCTRCGNQTEWGVRTMVFDMGESRPKDSAFWQDPFAAYRLPDGKKKGAAPFPIRPKPGQALWREFATLFLTEAGENRSTLRPAILDQIAEANLGAKMSTYPFRCIGLRTDMKAKIFEWVEAGFDIPPSLLNDPAGGLFIRDEMEFARDCAGVLSSVFRSHFGGSSKKQQRNSALKSRMLDDFWGKMAEPFRRLVLDAAKPDMRQQARKVWAQTNVRMGQDVFKQVTESLGDDGASLHQRAVATQKCRIFLFAKQKKHLETGGSI